MTKRKGRPAGSTNYEYQIVDHIPACCPSCGGTERERIRGQKMIVRDIPGETSDGQKWDRIIWRRYRCACGQLLMIRTRMAKAKK